MIKKSLSASVFKVFGSKSHNDLYEWLEQHKLQNIKKKKLKNYSIFITKLIKNTLNVIEVKNTEWQIWQWIDFFKFWSQTLL